MTKRYETTRADGAEPMLLIFPEGAYESLPIEVRMLGAWAGCSFGEMANLKPALRSEISQKGYAIVREFVGMLNAA
jgi:hypothetical protein